MRPLSLNDQEDLDMKGGQRSKDGRPTVSIAAYDAAQRAGRAPICQAV